MARFAPFHGALVLFVIVALAFLVEGVAFCCETPGSTDLYSDIGTVDLHPNQGVPSSWIASAVSIWDGCSSLGVNPGIDFPDFLDGGNSGGVQIDVVFIDRATSNDTCGEYIFYEIRIYRETSSGQSCSCDGDYGPVIAHELGHVMGLDHTDCSGYLMTAMGSACETDLQGSECEAADEAWTTPGEPETPEEPEENPCDDGSSSSSIWGVFGYGDLPEKVVDPCGEGGGGGGGGIGRVVKPCPTSPIVINLNRGGFRFTDIENGVEFDIAGDGILVQMSWTDPGEGDSFLGLDRNGNGKIDDGQELFGNFTEQPDSDSPNGYLALEVFDTPESGGNGDGVISNEDAVFGDLLLWVDANQNGYSEFFELMPLVESGVEELNLTYVVSERQDKHGNRIPFKSSARLAGGGEIQTCDVFFLSYEEE